MFSKQKTVSFLQFKGLRTRNVCVYVKAKVEHSAYPNAENGLITHSLHLRLNHQKR